MSQIQVLVNLGWIYNSAMGRGEVGTMRGRVGRQGNVRGVSRQGGNAHGRGVRVGNSQVEGRGAEISRGGALGGWDSIPTPLVGSADGRGAR